MGNYFLKKFIFYLIFFQCMSQSSCQIHIHICSICLTRKLTSGKRRGWKGTTMLYDCQSPVTTSSSATTDLMQVESLWIHNKAVLRKMTHIRYHTSLSD